MVAAAGRVGKEELVVVVRDNCTIAGVNYLLMSYRDARLSKHDERSFDRRDVSSFIHLSHTSYTLTFFLGLRSSWVGREEVEGRKNGNRATQRRATAIVFLSVGTRNN